MMQTISNMRENAVAQRRQKLAPHVSAGTVVKRRVESRRDGIPIDIQL
jgi:hypothetical protein